jgi:hypothetical protein
MAQRGGHSRNFSLYLCATHPGLSAVAGDVGEHTVPLTLDFYGRAATLSANQMEVAVLEGHISRRWLRQEAAAWARLARGADC